MAKYFAFGSNLSYEQMKNRVGAYGPLNPPKKTTLNGYELVYNKWAGTRGCYCANIQPSRGGKVEGVVYELNDRQISALNRNEGYYPSRHGQGQGYQKTNLRVNINGTPTNVFTYIAPKRRQEAKYVPNFAYQDIIVSGAIEHGLSQSYINKLKQQKIKLSNGSIVKYADELERRRNRAVAPQRASALELGRRPVHTQNRAKRMPVRRQNIRTPAELAETPAPIPATSLNLSNIGKISGDESIFVDQESGNRYQVVSSDFGKEAKIYKLKNERTGEIVKLKVNLRDGFMEEKEALTRLGRLKSVGKVNGNPYIITKWLPGRSLDYCFKENNYKDTHGNSLPFPMHISYYKGARCVDIGVNKHALYIKSAEKIKELVNAGVIHQDCHPGNYIVDFKNNDIQLEFIDFGIAKNLNKTEMRNAFAMQKKHGGQAFKIRDYCSSMDDVILDQKCGLLADDKLDLRNAQTKNAINNFITPADRSKLLDFISRHPVANKEVIRRNIQEIARLSSASASSVAPVTPLRDARRNTSNLAERALKEGQQIAALAHIATSNDKFSKQMADLLVDRDFKRANPSTVAVFKEISKYGDIYSADTDFQSQLEKCVRRGQQKGALCCLANGAKITPEVRGIFASIADANPSTKKALMPYMLAFDWKKESNPAIKNGLFRQLQQLSSRPVAKGNQRRRRHL